MACLLLALASAAGPALAQMHAPNLPIQSRQVAAQYWTDHSGRATLDAARAAFQDHKGHATDPSEVMPFGGDTAVWYRLQLPEVAAPTQAVFTVPIAGIDRLELFYPDAAGGWRSQRAGDALNVDQWPVRFLYPAFSLTLQPGQARDTYLRAQNNHAIRLDWQLQDAGSFMQTVKLWHLALGGYAGLIVLVILLSVAHTVSWRDSIHLYYAVHVVLVGLSILSLTGLAGEYLWPAHAWWNDKAPLVIPALSMGWACLFTRELVAERGRWMVSWLLLGVAAYSLLMVLAFLLMPQESFYRAPAVYAVPVMAVVLGVLAWYSRRRPEVGLWVVTGVAVLVASAIVPLMRNLGWLPVSFVTQFGLPLGGALEIPLVLIGLYFRSRESRDNRLRLEALAHTDPLTGVKNHRVLIDRMEHLLGRSRRDRSVGAVLRVHVSNLDAIRSQYGREAAEAALVRAAECLAREAAEGDTVAREQGGDLMLLLEGHVSPAQAAEAGRNIVARGLQFSAKLPKGATLALQVGGARAPLPNVDASVLLIMLRRMIVDLRHDALKRAVRFIEPPPSTRAARPSVKPAMSDA
jgi:diguanylate cyclase (GGDEF)-like protein